MKKILLGIALFTSANSAFAQDAPAVDQTAASIANITTSCPGKTLGALPEYDIPAGVLLGRLEPGGFDTSGNPTSYKYHDKEGHVLFIPAEKVELLFCLVQKHKPSNAEDTGYSMTFNPPMETSTHKKGSGGEKMTNDQYR